MGIGLGLLSLLLTAAEILKLLRQTLTPGFMLWTHACKALSAIVGLALSIWVRSGSSRPTWSLIGIVLYGCLV
jgi:hypothetical protein